jgi:hypothetical protein
LRCDTDTLGEIDNWPCTLANVYTGFGEEGNDVGWWCFAALGEERE